ncbi:hypothetical protein [Stieleria mannarensis]|uniref:hypothetical protein n=1 Tax=Stieleria mannarensis TaxID=2755585 RepID=UPI00160485F0|nr:hypothetical protein [Rhodopirellula sp. JC639]
MISSCRQRFSKTESVWSGLVLAVLVFSCGHGAMAETPQEDSSATGDRVHQTLRISTQAARQYEFEVAGTPPRKLDLHPSSILNWSNPVAGEIYGNVFLWTDRGRPHVIGSIFQWYSPMTHREPLVPRLCPSTRQGS